MKIRPLRTTAALTGYLILLFGAVLKVLDIVGYYQTAIDVAQGAPSLVKSQWLPILLMLIGFGFIAWSFYSERRRNATLLSALLHVATEERSIAPDDLGFTIRGVGVRAVVVWFENQTKYKLDRVRALLNFAVDQDKRIDYTGMWLDEFRRDIEFEPKERKALILIIERDEQYLAPSERRENQQHMFMPEFHPIGDDVCTIHLVLSIEGASGPRQPRFQIRMKGQLEVLTFWH